MKRTPFTRKSHHKGFKPRSKPIERSRKPVNRVGKSDTAKTVAKWERELVRDWRRWGYGQYCMARYNLVAANGKKVVCAGTLGLARAHSMKRVYAKRSRETYRQVIDACQACHDHLDLNLSHDEMFNEVMRIRAEVGIPE